MQSPYKSNNPKKRQMTSEDLKMTSNDFKRNSIENDKSVFKKVKTKKDLRGGDPNHNPTQGCVLIEQVFSPN